MKKKVKNIIFTTVFIILFIVLSVISFILADGYYADGFFGGYSVASFLFLLSLAGTFFPKRVYKILRKIGVKILLSSPYYYDAILGEREGYRTFGMINRGILVASDILLLFLILSCLTRP